MLPLFFSRLKLLSGMATHLPLQTPASGIRFFSTKVRLCHVQVYDSDQCTTCIYFWICLQHEPARIIDIDFSCPKHLSVEHSPVTQPSKKKSHHFSYIFREESFFNCTQNHLPQSCCPDYCIQERNQVGRATQTLVEANTSQHCEYEIVVLIVE